MSNPTPIENVFSALQNAPTYHPASANLFTDWLIQAGDVVTVSSDNESYSLPIFNLEMTWNGSSMVTVDATGKEKRDPPSALQRRNYGASKTQADVDGLHSEMIQFNDKIGLVVTSTVGGNVVNTASIIAAINGGDGHSSVAIEADKIILDGEAVAASLASESIECDGIDVGAGAVTLDNEGYIDCAGITVNGSTLDGSFDDWIVDASVSNNVLTLTKFDGSTVTFSKATTLTGTWSGGTYTVTASPQGNQEATTVILGPDGNGTSDNFSVIAYHDSVSATNVAVSDYVYLTDDTTNHKVQARWGSATGTVYAEKTYTGGGSHNIQIERGTRTGQQPSPSNAVQIWSGSPTSVTVNNNFYSFKVTCGSAEKWYYFYVSV